MMTEEKWKRIGQLQLYLIYYGYVVTNMDADEVKKEENVKKVKKYNAYVNEYRNLIEDLSNKEEEQLSKKFSGKGFSFEEQRDLMEELCGQRVTVEEWLEQQVEERKNVKK